jgi:hypothetical protein
MIRNDVYLSANTFCCYFPKQTTKKTKIIGRLSNIKRDITSNKKKVLCSIHRQEANFHDSIKTFTLRVTVTATQNCMVIKIIYCLEHTCRAWTPRSQPDGTQPDMYTYNEIHKHKTLYTLYI